MVNFEVASSSSFQEFLKRSFCDGEVGGRSIGVNTTAADWEELMTSFPLRM